MEQNLNQASKLNVLILHEIGGSNITNTATKTVLSFKRVKHIWDVAPYLPGDSSVVNWRCKTIIAVGRR